MADIFHEVDEEVRREQLKRLWDRYSIYLIALAVLIVASIALEAGLFDQPDPLVGNLFSALVITAVVTTLLVPIALRRVLRGQQAAATANPPDPSPQPGSPA